MRQQLEIYSDETKVRILRFVGAAIDALGGRAGTVVVMDPNNGRIFTIVNQRMGIGSPVKPCSTIKLVVGLAALHEGVLIRPRMSSFHVAEV
jgi:cell division protein FtsI/penicillin-binding protein 2